MLNHRNLSKSPFTRLEVLLHSPVHVNNNYYVFSDFLNQRDEYWRTGKRFVHDAWEWILGTSNKCLNMDVVTS